MCGRHLDGSTLGNNTAETLTIKLHLGMASLFLFWAVWSKPLKFFMYVDKIMSNRKRSHILIASITGAFWFSQYPIAKSLLFFRWSKPECHYILSAGRSRSDAGYGFRTWYSKNFIGYSSGQTDCHDKVSESLICFKFSKVYILWCWQCCFAFYQWSARIHSKMI